MSDLTVVTVGPWAEDTTCCTKRWGEVIPWLMDRQELYGDNGFDTPHVLIENITMREECEEKEGRYDMHSSCKRHEQAITIFDIIYCDVSG